MEPFHQARVRAIETYAEEFRRLAAGLHWIIPFPHGACSESSEILGALLQSHGFGTWEYVSRKTHWYGQIQPNTHAWIQQAGVVVDPTFDQFTDDDLCFDPQATLIYFDESRIVDRFPKAIARRQIDAESLWPDYRCKYDCLLPKLAHLALNQ